MPLLQQFLHQFMHALKNLLPMVQDGDSRGLAFSLPIELLTGIDLSQLAQFEQHLAHNHKA